MNDEYFSISLRVWHPSKSSNLIITTIGLEAEARHSVGAQRRNPAGKILGGTYRNTYCSFPLLDKFPGKFTESLPEILRRLHSHGKFLKMVSLEGGRSELFVGIFTDASTGFSLDLGLISTMAELSLELSVDVYY